MTDRPPPNSVILLGRSARQLLLTYGADTGRAERRLEGRQIRFGKAADCTVRLKGKAVPRIACLILNGRARTVVRSYWPAVCLNGRRFEQAELLPGDRLTIGSLAVQLIESPSPAADRSTNRTQPRRLIRLWRRRSRRLQARLRQLSLIREQLQAQLQEALARIDSVPSLTTEESAGESFAAYEELSNQLKATLAELSAQRSASESERSYRQSAEEQLARKTDEEVVLRNQLLAAESALAQAQSELQARLHEARTFDAHGKSEQTTNAEVERLHALLELAEADRAAVQSAYERSADNWRQREEQFADNIAKLTEELTQSERLLQRQSSELSAAEADIQQHVAASSERRRECTELLDRLHQAEHDRLSGEETLRAERDALADERTQLLADLNNHAQKLAAAETSIAQGAHDIQSCLARQQALEAALAADRAALSAAEELLAQAATDRTSAETGSRREFVELQDRANRADEALATTAADLTLERTARAEERERLQSELMELAQALAGAESAVAQRARVCEDLAAARQTLAAELAAVESTCAALRSEREDFTAVQRRMTSDLELEKSAQSELQRQLDRSREEQVATASELAEMRRALAEASELLTQVQAAEAAADAALAVERARTAESDRLGSSLQASLAESRQHCEEAELRAREFQAEINRLQAEIENAREQQLTQAADRQQAAAQRNQSERDEQQEAEILELRAAAADLRRRCGELEDREGRLQEELDCVRSELQHALAAEAHAEQPPNRWEQDSIGRHSLPRGWEDDESTNYRSEECAAEHEAVEASSEVHRVCDEQLDRLAELRREWEQARRHRRSEAPSDPDPQPEPTFNADETEVNEIDLVPHSEPAEAPLERQSPLNTLDVLRRYGFAEDSGEDRTAPLTEPLAESVPTGSPALAGDKQHEGHAPASDEDEHASTVDEYMRRLLARVGAKSDSLADSVGTPTSYGANTLRPQHSSPATNELTSKDAAAAPEETTAEVAAAAYVRRTAPERKSDLSALREVANQSSHLHLAKSSSRSLATQAQTRGVLALVSLLASGGLLWCNSLGIPYSLTAAAGAGVVSAVAIMLYVKTAWRCWCNKRPQTPPPYPAPLAEDPAEAQPNDAAEPPYVEEALSETDGTDLQDDATANEAFSPTPSGADDAQD